MLPLRPRKASVDPPPVRFWVVMVGWAGGYLLSVGVIILGFALLRR
jgi:hypothetical protein